MDASCSVILPRPGALGNPGRPNVSHCQKWPSACDIAAQATVSFSGSARRALETALLASPPVPCIRLFLDITCGVKPLEIDPQVGDLLLALDAGEDLFSTWNFGAGILDVFLRSSFQTMSDFLLASE